MFGIKTWLRDRARDVAMTSLVDPRRRWQTLNRLGFGHFDDCWIESGCCFQGDGLVVRIGAYINAGVFISSSAPVTIGECVRIGPGAKLIGVSHDIGTSAQRADRNVSRPITVGAGSWIGAGVIVLPGVTLGPGCVVGAGAVVTGDCDPNSIYAGVPARKMRDLGED